MDEVGVLAVGGATDAAVVTDEGGALVSFELSKVVSPEPNSSAPKPRNTILLFTESPGGISTADDGIFEGGGTLGLCGLLFAGMV